MRKLIALVAVVAVIAGAAIGQACSCVPPAPPKESLEKSHAVFSGKVTKIEDVADFERAVTLEVATSWKGVDQKELVIYTARDGAACGYGFEKGKSYLIYAHSTKVGEKKVLGTNICTRTCLLADAKGDLKELGEGTKIK
jgi:hypothetical protein